MMISRYREYAADRGAALITGAPENLMSALQKIASRITQIPQQDLREVAGMNAFFIIPAGLEEGRCRALHDAPAAREAARPPRRDLARDGPARSRRPLALGLTNVLFGRKKLKKARSGEALRDLDRADHARDRPRAEADRGRGRHLQAALGRRVRAGRERAPGAARRRRRRTRTRRSSAAATSSASSG